MNKIIISLILLSLITFSGCKKDGFGYKLYEPTLDDVDSIYFSAGDKTLIADGQAKLKFIVETYRKITKASGKDSMAFLDYRLLPQGSLKVFEAVSGKEVGLAYSTTTMPVDTVKFYAQIGTVKSAEKKVALRAKPTLPPKVFVDVIFHVWELNPTNLAYDPSSYQALKYENIVEGLRVMNEVVNNKVGSNPNGASANVEFRLAVKNPSGQNLTLPGYNKIVYSDEVKTNPLSATISVFDFPQYINKNVAAYIWNPDSYLNVHVLPSGSNNSMGTVFPAKQLPPGPGQTAIPGIPAAATGPGDYIKDYANATVGMPVTLFNPGFERRIEIFSFIGNFYGLYPTSTYTTARTHSDFCFDTQEFNNNDPRNGFISAIKVGINGEKFISDYAMDDTRYPSSRNSITLDQVTRMRAVMARAPGRMNTKPN